MFLSHSHSHEGCIIITEQLSAHQTFTYFGSFLYICFPVAVNFYRERAFFFFFFQKLREKQEFKKVAASLLWFDRQAYKVSVKLHKMILQVGTGSGMLADMQCSKSACNEVKQTCKWNGLIREPRIKLLKITIDYFKGNDSFLPLLKSLSPKLGIHWCFNLFSFLI